MRSFIDENEKLRREVTTLKKQLEETKRKKDRIKDKMLQLMIRRTDDFTKHLWDDIPPLEAESILKGKKELGRGGQSIGEPPLLYYSFFYLLSLNCFLVYEGEWDGKPAAIKLFHPTDPRLPQKVVQGIETTHTHQFPVSGIFNIPFFHSPLISHTS